MVCISYVHYIVFFIVFFDPSSLWSGGVVCSSVRNVHNVFTLYRVYRSLLPCGVGSCPVVWGGWTGGPTPLPPQTTGAGTITDHGIIYIYIYIYISLYIYIICIYRYYSAHAAQNITIYYYHCLYFFSILGNLSCIKPFFPSDLVFPAGIAQISWFDLRPRLTLSGPLGHQKI